MMASHTIPDAVPKGPWWFKCHEPERPGDVWTLYFWDCDACYLGLAADAQRSPNARADEWPTDDRMIVSMLGETLNHAGEWRLGQGLWSVLGAHSAEGGTAE